MRSPGLRWHLAVVAGGTGQRFGSSRPKQFLDLGGQPVVARTIRAFLDVKGLLSVVIACHTSWIEEMRRIVDEYLSPRVRIVVVTGGEHRQDSCRLALEALQARDDEIILMQDAVRPCVRREVIQSVLTASHAAGAAIPVLDSSDSMVAVENGMVTDYFDRNMFHRVQTPQGFRFAIIKEAHCNAIRSGRYHATDDASLVLQSGYPVAAVAGDPRNIKITTPSDLQAVQQYLSVISPD